MFQLDRLVYATHNPEEVKRKLIEERGMTLAATGHSFPGVATQLYPFGGGGFLEVAYIEDEAKLTESDGGLALQTFLQENGDGYYALVLETDDINHVKQTLEQEKYPLTVTPVREITDAEGNTTAFQMIGTYPHLPWFVQYNKTRSVPIGFPHAAILRTTTFTADLQLLEKIIGQPATMINFPNLQAAMLPLSNASLRIESADAYQFGYFEPRGLLLDQAPSAPHAPKS